MGERRGFNSYNFAYLFGSLNGDIQQRALVRSLIKEIHFKARRRWEKERQRKEGRGPRLVSDGSRCSGWVDGKMGRASFCRRYLHWEQVFSGAMPKWAPWPDSLRKLLRSLPVCSKSSPTLFLAGGSRFQWHRPPPVGSNILWPLAELDTRISYQEIENTVETHGSCAGSLNVRSWEPSSYPKGPFSDRPQT